MKKKILFLLDTLGLGGSEKTAINLAGLMDKYYGNMYEVEFLILGKEDRRISKKLYKVPDKFDIKFLYEENYPPFKKLIYSYKTAAQIKSFFFSNGLSYDYIVSFHDYSNLINIILKRYFKSKHKAIVSERKYSKCYFGKKFKFVKFLLKFIFDNADAIIVNDIDIKESLIKDVKVSNKNIYILHNLLIPPKNLSILPEAKDNTVNFVTVGRFSKEKNIKDAILAFSMSSYPNRFLHIIGDGPEKENLQSLVKKLDLTHRVKFVGQIENIFGYLSNMDVFIFTSLTEGFPNAVLEAMYVGLPIISYRFKAGITTLTCNGTYGILVEKGDIETFSYYMDLLASDKELRAEYSFLSKERVKFFTDEAKYISIFKRILDV